MPTVDQKRGERLRQTDSIAKRRPARSRTIEEAPRRPRASGLSRERIVTATIDYLRAHPHENLTIARSAAAAGATTMAVYRHFRDGADLAEAIVDRLLEGMSDEIPREGDWRTQLRAWIDVMYQRFTRTPQCIDLMTTANGLSTASIRASQALRGILAAAGVQDPELTRTTFWLSSSLVGYARHMLAAPVDIHIKGSIAAIERLDPEGTSELSKIAPNIPQLYADAREIMIERMLASVEAVIPGER